MKRTFLYIALILLVHSCADEELKPIITFDDAGKGAYVRLVSLNQDLVIDPTQVGSSGIDMDVDFVDPQGGATITDYNIYITFQDLTPENGDNSKAETQIRAYGPSDFGTSELGNVGLSVNIPATEMLSTLGLTESDINATDRFRVRSEVIDQDGRVFSAANSTPPIANFDDAFGGAFSYNLNVACPVADDFLAGTYTVEYVTDPNPGGFGPTISNGSTVTLVPNGSTVRTFDVTYLPGIGGFAQTFSIDLLCEITRFRPHDTGLGCGGGSITLEPGEADGTMDLTDDSEITVTFINQVQDGGCGVAPYPATIRLVKQ